MKKIFNNKIAIVMLIALSLIACDKEFLEETNPNEISTDSFWKSVDDLTLGINAVYNTFKDGSIMLTGDETVRADLAYPGYGRPNTTNEYYLKTFNDASTSVNNKWQALYKGIFRANQVIEACDRLMGTLGSTQKEKSALEILAQAKFFRGLFYFYLHNSFNQGAVPIFNFVPATESDFYQPISTAETVRDFYIADLEFAKENLPATWELSNDKGRVTSGAATAVLGKSYLYAKDYVTAKEYFKSVINDFDYSLTPNIGSNFTTADELNSESILEINYSLNYKAEINPYAAEQTSSLLNFTFSSAQTGGYRSVYPACWLIMEYKNEKLDYSDERNLITEEDGTVRLRDYSLRTSYSIALVDDRDLEYYGATTAQKSIFNGKETAYWRKYTNWDITDNEKNISQSTPRSGVNVRVIRLSDVLLMYAECLIEGGNNDGGVDEALLAINKVRHRSAVQLLGLNLTGDYPANDHDNISYTAQSLMHHLMYIERPLELSAEGMAIRVMDLRRWGITKQRYQELSLKRYNVKDYDFVDLNGKNQTRWGSVLIETDEADSHPDLNEFEQSAENYNEAEHGYWPIPNSEVVANPNLYNNK
ncbi:RagB/SusD family nutrient uptake outer membrane protein [Polaribacter sp. Z014]|uniref:RagB/SusD family nutrient uptake outer membrane protein n=1 Tax=Polaribacter sp. Z014 TaxID=2927126 RepID=UPI002020FA34|nr:RagB/SusD family nutrient uptake outer membrane protein [Polaribacter sp. Z014]MCL7762602.1 RagB/SusD family nutrient uptake outer membrane protein [Polaribacter sp. Z014]